ncbi:GTP cyclohydrolase-2 [Striga asiatica]|uniref:GTP cyclohydrolase-2 n=1 Tax=Striga asiatica TaxID=4170 RepID=A0A5A7P509_STRAF|nr:GTP cyclohydrolase-2 [Striga asiatica]
MDNTTRIRAKEYWDSNPSIYEKESQHESECQEDNQYDAECQEDDTIDQSDFLDSDYDMRELTVMVMMMMHCWFENVDIRVNDEYETDSMSENDDEVVEVPRLTLRTWGGLI